MSPTRRLAEIRRVPQIPVLSLFCLRDICSGASPVACLEGLEPPTYCLEGSCSIQLSYRHMYVLRTCMFLRPLDFSIRDNCSGAPLNEKFVFTAEP